MLRYAVIFFVIALIAAGLFLRSLQSAYSTNLGFNPDNVLMVSLDVFPNGYSSERGRQFYANLLDDVRRLPGVRAATLARRISSVSHSFRAPMVLRPTRAKSRCGFNALLSAD